MSEQNAKVPPNTGGDNNPPQNQPQNSPPQNNPPQTQPQNPPSQNQPFDAEKFMTALNALPETIAKSVREAIGTPSTPPKTEPEKKTEKVEPGKIEPSNAQPQKGTGTAGERFRTWWFK